MTDNLKLLWLQKIHDASVKTRDEHTIYFKGMKPSERFLFNEPIPKISILGLITLSKEIFVFNATEKNANLETNYITSKEL